MLTAVLLSLATIGSAWCAFQSTLWGGVQTFELVASGKAGRLSSENFVKANQKRTIDAIMVKKYIDANEGGNINMRDFYFSKFDTVLFAGVLFFGGIASSLQSKLVRNVCLILSAVILCVTFGVLMSLPVTTI